MRYTYRYRLTWTDVDGAPSTFENAGTVNAVSLTHASNRK
jgi:hypothetical protein